MIVVVWTDGYADADGAGWAFVARGAGVDHAESGALAPSPSHVAEWTAMERALRWAESTLEGVALEIRTDSALVAKGLASRRPAMSGEAAGSRAECRRMLARLAGRGVRARVVRVGRGENGEADGLAREGARRGQR